MDNDTLIESGGFIKLYHSMLKWEWYDDNNVKILFLHLLLKANYETKKWHGLEIEKGCLLTSRNKLAKETGLSIQQIKTCLKKLKQTGEITCKATRQYTMIKIEKYGFFQSYEQENNPQNNLQTTHEQPTGNLRATTTKEIKEYNKYNNINKYKEFKEPKEKPITYQLIAERKCC